MSICKEHRLRTSRVEGSIQRSNTLVEHKAPPPRICSFSRVLTSPRMFDKKQFNRKIHHVVYMKTTWSASKRRRKYLRTRDNSITFHTSACWTQVSPETPASSYPTTLSRLPS